MKVKIILFLLMFLNTRAETGVHLKLESHLGSGFFSELWILLDGIFNNLNKELVSIDVNWRQQFFPYKNEPHENGWDLFFEPISVDNKKHYNSYTHHHETFDTIKQHKLHFNWCSDYWITPDKYKDYRLHVHQALEKYVKIKPHILREIDTFYNKNMDDCICIGVHVRYCDLHGKEIPTQKVPELEEYYEEIDTLLSNLNASKITIFIAADSHYAINAFKERYGDKVVYIDAFRDSYRGDPHLIDVNTEYWLTHPEEFHMKKPGYQGGKEALMDCLLLSKCDYFIHTASNLAAFVIYFNPYIKSVFLPREIEASECKCPDYVSGMLAS